MRKALGLAALALAVASVAACGGSSAPPAPSVAACTKAYPAWFAASAAAGKTTATPPACKGLTDTQIAEIGVKYMGSAS